MLQYLFKFSISLAVLFIFYRAVLRPLTFYQWNRFYLLSYSLLSFVIPFINITPWVSAGSNQQLLNSIPAIGDFYIINGSSNVAEPGLLQRLTPADWLLIAFCTGALAMLVKLLVQYLSLRAIRRRAVLLNGGAGVQLYETPAVVSPFSFGNAIYFNRQLHTEEELQRIIQHEFVHVKQKHTIDLLVGELLCVVNWFNPFAWLVRNSIKQNLEFIADNNVVANGLDKREYQYLLLKVVGIPQYSIANNFNFSHLKKRIAMMNKMKSAQLHLTRFLFVLPLMALLFLAFRKVEKDTITKAGMLNKQSADTLPPPPVKATGMPAGELTSMNKKGYIVTVADNNGECVVLVKDRNKKIVKAITLAEWNKNKQENENQYGELPPPPPPPPALLISVSPVAPVSAKLPEGVKGISIHTDINTKSTTNINKATVTLKNGHREIYNLDNAAEKAAYVKKYGVLPAPPPPPPVPPVAPSVSVSAVDPLAPIEPDGYSARPLYIINGVEETASVNISSIQPNQIKSVTVLKDQAAIDKYGNKGIKGVVEVNTMDPIPAVNAAPPAVYDIKSFDQDKLTGVKTYKQASIRDVLLVIDGEEMPLGSNPEELDPSAISSMHVLKGAYAAIKYGDKAKNGAIEIETKIFSNKALLIIDGKEMPAGSKWEDFIKPGDMQHVESVNIWRSKDAAGKFGEKGKRGVIEIKTKNAP